MARAKQANESSATDPKESKHGEDLYQNAGEGDRSYAIDFKGGQNFGERQPVTNRGRAWSFISTWTLSDAHNYPRRATSLNEKLEDTAEEFITGDSDSDDFSPQLRDRF